MKITVNGKKHELGKSLGRESCKVGIEKLAELSGTDLRKVELVSFKHKSGVTGMMASGQKVIASEGSVFTVTAKEASDATQEN